MRIGLYEIWLFWSRTISIDPKKKKFKSFEMRFKRNAFPSFHIRVTNLSRDTTGGGGWMKYSKVLYITNSPFTRDKAKKDVKGKYY